jgi:hypothetical protein
MMIALFYSTPTFFFFKVQPIDFSSEALYVKIFLYSRVSLDPSGKTKLSLSLLVSELSKDNRPFFQQHLFPLDNSSSFSRSPRLFQSQKLDSDKHIEHAED